MFSSPLSRSMCICQFISNALLVFCCFLLLLLFCLFVFFCAKLHRGACKFLLLSAIVLGLWIPLNEFSFASALAANGYIVGSVAVFFLSPLIETHISWEATFIVSCTACA